MSKKSITQNYIYNIMYQFLVMVIPLITTPYLSRVLGAENIGIYSYTLSITTYFILFGSLGVAMYGQREIAFVQNDVKKRSIVFYELLLMRFITLGISLLLFYFAFCLKGDYISYFKILILEIIANSLDISWYFQGLEEFKKTVIRNIVVKLVSIICIFAFVRNASDLYRYFIIYVLSTFIGNLTLWFYIPKYIHRPRMKELKICKHIKPAVLLFIPQIAAQIYLVLDKVMIGAIVLEKSEVGYYEQAQKIIRLLLTIATSLSTVMMPRIATLFASGDKEKISDYMYKSFSFIMMLAFPLMFGIISISESFVPIFFGQGFDKVRYLLNIISPIIIFVGLSSTIGTQYLLPTNKQKALTISVLIGAIINFLLNIFLIKKFASIGASVATVIAELSVAASQFVLIKSEIKFAKVIKLSKKYIISSIIMIVISIFIGNIIYNDLVSIIVQIIVSVLIYFTVLVLMKDEFVLNTIDILKRRFWEGINEK